MKSLSVPLLAELNIKDQEDKVRRNIRKIVEQVLRCDGRWKEALVVFTGQIVRRFSTPTPSIGAPTLPVIYIVYPSIGTPIPSIGADPSHISLSYSYIDSCTEMADELGGWVGVRTPQSVLVNYQQRGVGWSK